MTDWYSEPNASIRTEWSTQNIEEVRIWGLSKVPDATQQTIAHLSYKLKRKLITANHILHYHGVVDAYGHISIRHPQNPAIYIMCGYMAPGVVTSSNDLIDYYVADSSTVDPNAKKGYSERFIHGEMFRKYESVNCVVHSHAEEVLPYVSSGVPLLPVFHMAGFLGTQVPIFDIADEYKSGDQQDLLVRNAHFGTALANKFQDASLGSASATPDSAVVLMRRHGFTTHGADIETAVYRAIYTKTNAAVQTSAMSIRNSFLGSGAPFRGYSENFEFEPLTKEMCDGCTKMNEGTQDKPWRLWVAEVENSPLYTNRG